MGNDLGVIGKHRAFPLDWEREVLKIVGVLTISPVGSQDGTSADVFLRIAKVRLFNDAWTQSFS